VCEDSFFSINVWIGWSSQDDRISLSTSVSEAALNTVQGWCTAGKSILQLKAETGKEAWIWVILSLKCLEKELQSELVESWEGKRNRSLSMESPIYTDGK